MGSGSDSSMDSGSGSSSSTSNDSSMDSGSGSSSTSMDSGSGSSSTSMGSGSDDNVYGETCVDVKQSDGTEWFDADGEYYDCEWYGSYESYCDWYGDDYASELDGITASQACCTCGGGSTADHGDSGSGSDLLLLEAKAKSKGPIMAKPIQGESMLVDVDAVVPEYENAFREGDVILAEVGSSMGSGSDSSMDSGSGSSSTSNDSSMDSGSGSSSTSMDSGSGSSSTSMDSGSGSDDNVYGETCVDVKQSDGTEWF